MLKFVRYAAWATLVALVLFIGATSVLWYQRSTQTEQAVFPSVGGDFSLIATNGERMSEADFLGKPRAMFFGFTHCPDACPTTLFEAGNWLKQLGEDADKLSFLFVSVDPERDTPQAMKDYVSAFDSRIVGLTGTPADIEALVKAYRLFVRKQELEGGDYTVDHTASVYLMDSQGRFVGSINYKADQEEALAKLRKLIGEG